MVYRSLLKTTVLVILYLRFFYFLNLMLTALWLTSPKEINWSDLNLLSNLFIGSFHALLPLLVMVYEIHQLEKTTSHLTIRNWANIEALLVVFNILQLISKLVNTTTPADVALLPSLMLPSMAVLLVFTIAAILLYNLASADD